MSTTAEREADIGKHSRITLGLAVAILAVVVGATVTGIGMYDSLVGKVNKLQESQFTKDDQMRWVLELKIRNPQLDIPVPTWTAAPRQLPTGPLATAMHKP